jgi:hypothetical protein
MPCGAIAYSISFTKGTPAVQGLTSSFMALPPWRGPRRRTPLPEGDHVSARDEDDFTTVGEIQWRSGSPRPAFE